MRALKWIITYGCKLGLRMMYRVEASEMRGIRAEGPLLLYTNHRGLAEAPVIYTFLAPRKRVSALAKVESWKNPFLGLVFSQWGIIPLRRGEADMEAMRAALDALGKGYILGVAPEGTRSSSGALRRARGGVAVLALRSGSPLQPIAHWLEPRSSRLLGLFRRRPIFHIRVGRAFRLELRGERMSREVREAITEEIMYKLAELLPGELRGDYADASLASEKWLAFEEAP
jgi:1-acyl-sn-glycerol-3-phosphate acyltransferase